MRLFFLHFFVFLGILVTAQKTDLSMEAQAVDTPMLYDFYIIDSILNNALSYKGVPYKYGGRDSKGMDCSGLICKAYKDASIEIPHNSIVLSQIGKAIEADSLIKGDLIFFKGRNSAKIGHVAMVSKIEDGLIYMVHSTSSRGVIEEPLQNNTYFLDKWVFNRRIVE